MENEEERLQILEMIERGTISAEQGIQLLNALNGSADAPAFAELPGAIPEPEPLPEAEPAEEPSAKQARGAAAPSSPTINRWRNWWQIPLWIGVVITVGSALLMYLTYQNANDNYFWFACTWFPFMLGVVLLAVAASSRSARWLHVRITQAPGESPQHINISLPIPLRLTAWFIRTFRHRIPGMQEVPDVDGLLTALRKTTPDEPFHVVVDDDEDGERVEIFIG